MTASFKTVYVGGEGEIVEKKSRFIATVQPVESEEAAIAFIEQMKKKYWNATHNCSAFVIGRNQEIQRCSDDGEPSQTAGRPILDVLLGEDIHNAVIVVTRYFGGTLLGTGGLVRAYSKAAQEGLLHCTLIVKNYAFRLSITTDYNGIGKVQYILGQNHIPILNSSYTDTVSLEAMVPIEKSESVSSEITEGTYGRAKLTKGSGCYYAVVDGEILLFDN